MRATPHSRLDSRASDISRSRGAANFNIFSTYLKVMLAVGATYFSTRATIHERQTRNRDSLNIPPSRIIAGQRAFYYRGVKVWNDLSKELREITNTKVFKRRLINELICDMN